MHQEVQYEDAYEDQDGIQLLINDMNANVNSELRVRGVVDLNDMHVVNGIGTNDVFLNVNVNNCTNGNLNGVPVRDTNVYVNTASAPSMRAWNYNQNAHGAQNESARERVPVVQAAVHAAPQPTGAPVSRGLCPFSPEPGVTRADNAAASMSAVTYCTTTTTTALPFATRSRDDYYTEKTI